MTQQREQCADCAELSGERKRAVEDGDLSRVTDCDVLLGRHPDHSVKLSPVKKRRRAGDGHR